MSILFTPIQFRGITLPNRIAFSPMCQYSADDGVANDWHLVHLGGRAVGGAGLVFVEATGVEARGRITPGCLGIYDDKHIEPLRRITRFIRSQGVVPGIQIGHAGRKASCGLAWDGGKPILTEADGGWKTVAASAIPVSDAHSVPEALDEAGIAEVKEAFRKAAERALAAEFDVLELHAAHGYLIHTFLSPLANQRTDRYGGSFDNRIRFLCETVQEVRKAWPDHLPLFVRISATDWVDGGWTGDDSVQLARVLQGLGVDLIDCSTGSIVLTAKIPVGPGYQVPFAEQVRREAGIATAAVGLITEAQQAEAILQEEKADLILVGREALRDPYWPLRAAYQLGDYAEARWPNQYLRAKPPAPKR